MEKQWWWNMKSFCFQFMNTLPTSNDETLRFCGAAKIDPVSRGHVLNVTFTFYMEHNIVNMNLHRIALSA